MNHKLIGRKISRLREELGITTTALAKKVNLSQAQISRLENGKQGFRSKTLVKLAGALGVKPLYFFLDEDEVPAARKVFDGTPRYGSKRSATISKALSYPEFATLTEKVAASFLSDKVAFRPVSKLIAKAVDAPREDRRDAMRVLRTTYAAVPKRKRKKKT